MGEDKLTLIFDIDGTLCPIKNKEERYEDLVPYPKMLEQVKAYHNEGAYIILHTSRNMNSYQGNLGRINVTTAKVLLDWLEKWEVPYDEIIYGKPWPGKTGFYVDDRAIRPNEFLAHSAEELIALCEHSREENL